MESIKIHPKVIMDDSGLKFIFNHDGTHFTLRFSGKPLFLIEEWYYKLWGQIPDFPTLYSQVCNGWDVDAVNLELIEQAVTKSNEVFEVIERIWKRRLSPFTIYAQPFDSFKFRS